MSKFDRREGHLAVKLKFGHFRRLMKGLKVFFQLT